MERCSTLQVRYGDGRGPPEKYRLIDQPIAARIYTKYEFIESVQQLGIIPYRSVWTMGYYRTNIHRDGYLIFLIII